MRKCKKCGKDICEKCRFESGSCCASCKADICTACLQGIHSMVKGFDERVWYKVFRCPKCGYETTVTNICRQCHKMPITEECWCPVWCSWHEVAHRVDGKWVAHKSIGMEETGWANRFNPVIEKEEYKKIGFLPEGAILK